MNATMLSKEKMDLLFHHILDGFKSSAEGLLFLKRDHIIDEHEYTELLEKNAKRVIARIEEFKMVNKLLSIGFAGLFVWMQVSGDDMDLRKPSRTRSGRRKNESEQIIELPN